MTFRSKSTRALATRGAFMIIGALALANVEAQTMPKEGKYDYTSCFSGTTNVIEFSKTHSAMTYETVGNHRTNPLGGAFDMTAHHCVGMFSSLYGKTTNSHYCESTDMDGDKWMTHAVCQGSKCASETVAGTGKYEGMVRSGTEESVGAFPPVKPGTFTGCNRNAGTYKLK